VFRNLKGRTVIIETPSATLRGVVERAGLFHLELRDVVPAMPGDDSFDRPVARGTFRIPRRSVTWMQVE
jgi:hypothetical protein